MKRKRCVFPPARTRNCITPAAYHHLFSHLHHHWTVSPRALQSTCCSQTGPCLWSLPQGFFQDSAVPLIDVSLLVEVNLGISSKYLFKPLFFHPFYAFIFVYVQFLRTAVEMVSMDLDSIVQSTGRFHKHVCKIRAVNYLPSDYISI